MGTVLEKPVLLDETGQAIVNKLDEIKNAIDNGGSEKYPVLIHITTPPTKTMYKVGEAISYAGIVVKAVFSNNVEYDITEQCTITPAAGTLFSITNDKRYMEMTVTYTWHPTSTTFTASMMLTWDEMEYLRVTTPPTKTTYTEGEQLDLTGMVVKKIYHDGTEVDVTSACTFSPANGDVLSYGTTSVTVYYTDPDSPSGATWQAWQSITVNELPIYGVEWDGTASSAWTRTDKAANFTDPEPYYSGMLGNPSSPFDSILPWSGMQIVDDADLGKLVSIPKFWFKWTRDEAKMKLQISPISIEGFHVSPAHADRGDGTGERDYVYVGRYQCVATTYKSTSGALPANNKNIADFRTAIANLHSKAWQWDFAMWWTISMLYLVEFADWNSQAKIGGGCGLNESPSSLYNTGETDNMPYHTGTTMDSISSDKYGPNQYRFIENLWGNIRCWIDGIYFSDRDIYGISNPANFANDAGGTNIGIRANITGVASKWTNPLIPGFEYALYPSETIVDNNYESYSCDGCYYYSTTTAVYLGGTAQNSQESGLFNLRTNPSATTNQWIGSRLQKLP